MDWASIIKPVVSAAFGYMQADQQHDQKKEQANALEQLNQQNYAAYQQYMAYKNAAASSGGGGGGGGGAKKDNSAQLAAKQKALDTENQYFDKAASYLTPYANAAAEFLPGQIQTYKDTLGILGAIQQSMDGDFVKKALATPKTAQEINLQNYTPSTNLQMKVPSYLKGK